MTAPPPRRPWWKKKRTWAAVVLWLLVAYPLSYGPASYAWIRWGYSADPFYDPLIALTWNEDTWWSRTFAAYSDWWGAKAYADEGWPPEIPEFDPD